VTGRYGAPIATGPVVGPAQFKGTTRPSLYAVLGGPQIGWPAGRLAPFVHAGVGVAWERAGFNAVDFTSVQTDTGLAAALGGGVDVAWTHRVALRVEVDALRTAVFQGSRHHVSVSAGVRVGLGR
jgi:opacity protein-like surface antigen